jgi:hypothetical protein
MSGPDSQDIDRIIQELQRLQDGASGLTKGLRERNNAEKALSKELLNKTERASDALGALSSSASNASQYFTRVLGGTALGAAFMKLINVGNTMTSTYRELVNVGQNFEGSILNMSIAAAGAGMPLADFANAVKLSSKVVARMGMKDFVALNKSVNQSMIKHGMYAMTTEQVTQHMGGMLETNRRMGMVERMTHTQVSSSFVKLMGHTTALSSASGVAREEIQQMAQSAIQSSMAMSRMATMSNSTAVRANQNFQESMAVLASHGQEAAQFLTGLHAEAFGQASAAFTDQGRSLISVGLGHLGTMFEKEMTAEQTIEAQQRFRSEIEANIPMLRNLAKGTGESAANARKLLAVHSDMQKLSVAEYRRKKKEAEVQDGLTKLFTTFGAAWNLVVAGFKEGFLKGFKPLFASVGDFTKSGAFKSIETGAASLGEKMGDFVAWVFSPGTMKSIGDGLSGMAGFLGNLDWKAIGAGALTLGGAFIALKSIQWGGILTGLSLFASGLTLLTNHLSPEAIGALGAGMAGLMLVTKGFGALNSIRGLFGGRNMNVNAGTVIVNGAMGGGYGRGNGRQRSFAQGHGETTRGKSRAERLRSINERRAAAGNSRIGGRMGRLGGAARGLGRRIPGLNMLFGAAEFAGAGSTAGRLGALGGMAGGTGGMMAGAAAGAALGSIVPVVGTAVGGLIGGVLGGMGGDTLGRSIAGGIASPGNAGRGGRKWGRMAMMAGGVGALGVAGAAAYSALSGEEEAPKTKDSDPLLRKLDEVVAATKQVNDSVMQTQQGIASLNTKQTALLSKISKQPSNS